MITANKMGTITESLAETMLTDTPIFCAVLPMAKKILINIKPKNTV